MPLVLFLRNHAPFRESAHIIRENAGAVVRRYLDRFLCGAVESTQAHCLEDGAMGQLPAMASPPAYELMLDGSHGI